MAAQARISALINEARKEGLSDAWLAKRLHELFELMWVEQRIEENPFKTWVARTPDGRTLLTMETLACRARAYLRWLESQAENPAAQDAGAQDHTKIQQMFRTVQAIFGSPGGE